MASQVIPNLRPGLEPGCILPQAAAIMLLLLCGSLTKLWRNDMGDVLTCAPLQIALLQRMDSKESNLALQ